MAMKKPISYLYNCWELWHKVGHQQLSSRKVKDGCKVWAWFSEERLQQLGYFSLFIARELRIEDVNDFQAAKPLETV